MHNTHSRAAHTYLFTLTCTHAHTKAHAHTYTYEHTRTNTQCIKRTQDTFTKHANSPIQVYELDGAELKLSKEVEKPSAFKCGNFGASSLVDRRLTTGNFAGKYHTATNLR
jgi:hypothetical protein